MYSITSSKLINYNHNEIITEGALNVFHLLPDNCQKTRHDNLVCKRGCSLELIRLGLWGWDESFPA